MGLHQPFEKGVFGVLHIDWTLELLTPLTIHNGEKAAYSQQDPTLKKGRGMEQKFAWLEANSCLKEPRKKRGGWSEVADFNYAFCVRDGQVEAEYAIPGSSIRGALRNAAIRAFEKRENWQVFSLPKKPEQDDEASQAARKAKIDRALQLLEDQYSGWHDILSLFGCVFELEEQQQEPLVWGGRLRVNVDPLDTADGTMEGVSQVDTGPDNIHRHVNVRNPLDRVTHAAKDGGLHFRVEMSEGQRFRVHLDILNPRKTDLELLEAWHEDIDDGLLRFGALTNQGRGRMRIAEEQYSLYWSISHPLADQLPPLAGEQLLSGIWNGGELSFDALKSLEFS